MQLSNDTRHRMLCHLADWFILSLPPGVSEFSRIEIWDKEYDYLKLRMDDMALWEAARETGFGETADDTLA